MSSEVHKRPGKEVRLAGLRQTWRRAQRADGSSIDFLDLADLAGTLRVLIGEDVYMKCRSQLVENLPLLITGRLRVGSGGSESLFNASKVQRLDSLTLNGFEAAPQRQEGRKSRAYSEGQRL
jgi:DNA polymerase III alpha subunit